MDETVQSGDIGSPEKLRTLKRRVETNSKEVDRLVEMIVTKYNKDLDDFIRQMRDLVHDRDKRQRDLTDVEIEIMCLKIPLFMYFAASGLETLGVEGDSAKAVKLEVFNAKYLNYEGTIKDKEKYAELETMNEYVVEIAYTRAYKKLKTQIEMAEHLFSGAKKILSKRMLEIQIANNERPM